MYVHIHTVRRRSIDGNFEYSSQISNKHNFNYRCVQIILRDADPPVSCVRVYWPLSISISPLMYVRKCLVGARVIAFHKCRTNFFNKFLYIKIYIYFCYSMYVVLFMITQTIIWREAHTTKFVYCLRFEFYFALSVVLLLLPSHYNNTHIPARVIVHKVFESKVVQKQSIVWPVEWNCYWMFILHLILHITWYLIVLQSPKLHLQRIFK